MRHDCRDLLFLLVQFHIFRKQRRRRKKKIKKKKKICKLKINMIICYGLCDVHRTLTNCSSFCAREISEKDYDMAHAYIHTSNGWPKQFEFACCYVLMTISTVFRSRNSIAYSTLCLCLECVSYVSCDEHAVARHATARGPSTDSLYTVCMLCTLYGHICVRLSCVLPSKSTFNVKRLTQTPRTT